MHDAAHYRAYASRSLNDFVGELLALPTSASMAGYRNTHFAHHRELNSANDPRLAAQCRPEGIRVPGAAHQRA